MTREMPRILANWENSNWPLYKSSFNIVDRYHGPWVDVQIARKRNITQTDDLLSIKSVSKPVICSKISPIFDKVPTTDFLPLSKIFNNFRY